MSGHHKRRPAFTLTEMLVVIAIIGVLVSLLLPAVQFARERSRMTSCLNQMRQMGLAVANHGTALKRFPNGGMYDAANTPANWDHPKRVTPPGVDGWGWAYQLLPYMEETAFYKSPPDVAAGAIIRAYFCPTRRPPVAEVGKGCGLMNGPRGGIDYAGNAGHEFGPFVLTSTPNEAQVRQRFPDPESWTKTPSGLLPNGVFLPSTMRKVGHGDFPDGASSTILIGERRWNRRSINNALNHQDEDNGYVAGFTWDTLRWGYFDPANPQPVIERDDGSTLTADTKFGSSHSGVCQFVFCDGSTRAISYTVDGNVFRWLTGRNDNKAPEIPEG